MNRFKKVVKSASVIGVATTSGAQSNQQVQQVSQTQQPVQQNQQQQQQPPQQQQQQQQSSNQMYNTNQFVRKPYELQGLMRQARAHNDLSTKQMTFAYDGTPLNSNNRVALQSSTESFYSDQLNRSFDWDDQDTSHLGIFQFSPPPSPSKSKRASLHASTDDMSDGPSTSVHAAPCPDWLRDRPRAPLRHDFYKKPFQFATNEAAWHNDSSSSLSDEVWSGAVPPRLHHHDR
mmetsp:Transcript_13468/g.23263  ORF Transcript_13468/g.23263 Transcript_13468/m.23263 type:complete len:232 (+) Transcript_13468:207-902(+)